MATHEVAQFVPASILAERCGQATGPDFDLSQAIFDLMVGDFGFVPDRSHVPYPGYHYTASLDAAMTLVPEGWQSDGLRWWTGCEASCILIETHLTGGEWVRETGWLGRVEADAATPALALCVAALKARAASVDTLPKGRDTK